MTIDDLSPLFDGDLDDLRNTFMALRAHAHNHQDELDADVRQLWRDQLRHLEDALQFLSCSSCQGAALVRVRNGDFLCPACAGRIDACQHCQRLTPVGDLDPDGDDECVCLSCRYDREEADHDDA